MQHASGRQAGTKRSSSSTGKAYDSLGIPETNLRGLSTRMARKVRRSTVTFSVSMNTVINLLVEFREINTSRLQITTVSSGHDVKGFEGSPAIRLIAGVRYILKK